MWYMAQDRLTGGINSPHPAIRPVYTIGLDTAGKDVNKAAATGSRGSKNQWVLISSAV